MELWEGAMSPGKQATSRSWKEKEVDAPLESPEGTQSCQ